MKYLITLALASLSTASAFADSALGLKAGTLGVGVDLIESLPLSQPGTIDLRINGNYFTYSTTRSYSENKYDGKLKLNSLGVLLDWYPLHGAFRLSAGGYYTGSKLDLHGTPGSAGFEFNGTTYTSAEIGQLNGRAKFSHAVAPYLGLGWGNPVGASKQWSFFSDLGVIFTGSPTLTLTAIGGTESANPLLLQNLEVERRKAQHDVDSASVYPVASIGLAYKF